MTQITEKYITEATLKIDGLTEDSLERISEAHVLAQDVFVGYILSSAVEYENDALLDYLIYYFNIFSEAFSMQGVKMKKIDEEMIDGFQEEYIQTLDEYMETDDQDLIASMCNQPMMVSFLIHEITGEDETGAVMEEDLASHVFIVGVAMIALMNRAIIKD
ncbi:hypothetical protein [Brumimicrobium aurantiacum]|uniref:Uncharacterized protein n=1 Tax=Brumimicrobium aurantiacum TaxID=1737063 RepID=A0A3E1EXU3_9FLAO|nr:hypothetical protein [Brumimicrobium aurantiacum]RFC54358.1 hypothetical protein DXU93_07990 [Brumimicrobium aurantiacum]